MDYHGPVTSLSRELDSETLILCAQIKGPPSPELYPSCPSLFMSLLSGIFFRSKTCKSCVARSGPLLVVPEADRGRSIGG